MAEKPLADLSFSKETLFPFLRGTEQLFWWKNIFSLERSSVIKP
jgi:hypothetical protein